MHKCYYYLCGSYKDYNAQVWSKGYLSVTKIIGGGVPKISQNVTKIVGNQLHQQGAHSVVLKLMEKIISINYCYIYKTV